MGKDTIPADLQTQGYSLLQGPKIATPAWSEIIGTDASAFKAFHQSWNDLPADNFLSDGGHYRFRRYSVFNWKKDGTLTLLPHEPHYQSTYRNNMNGGIYRDFEPFKKETIDSPVLKKIIDFTGNEISFNGEEQWRIQAHQFRIQAKEGEAGQPTPEGIHKDGADFILIMVLERHNITGGVNHIYDNDKRLVFGSVLEDAGDAIILDDRKVWHGVSEVYPIDKKKPGYRDVLVLTFHNKMLG